MVGSNPTTLGKSMGKQHLDNLVLRTNENEISRTHREMLIQIRKSIVRRVESPRRKEEVEETTKRSKHDDKVRS
jgi:hypothetical protein